MAFLEMFLLERLTQKHIREQKFSKLYCMEVELLGFNGFCKSYSTMRN